MATPAPTKTEVYGGCTLHTWVLTTADHTGEAIELPGAADRSVHFVSAAWGSATAALEGSNEGTTFGALQNAASGSAITATAAGALQAVVENCRYIRPRLSTVGTDAVVSVYLLSRTT
jgi:hypothetical protein